MYISDNVQTIMSKMTSKNKQDSDRKKKAVDKPTRLSIFPKGDLRLGGGKATF